MKFLTRNFSIILIARNLLMAWKYSNNQPIICVRQIGILFQDSDAPVENDKQFSRIST